MTRLRNMTALACCALIIQTSASLAAKNTSTDPNESQVLINGVARSTSSWSALQGNPASSFPSDNPGPKRIVSSVPFIYREFMKALQAKDSHSPRLRPNHPMPHRDEDVLIDFDDRQVAGSWDGIDGPARDEYADLGVHFRGPNERDGGAPINESGNFGVNGHSRPNFFAFNPDAGYRGDGTPRGPEWIIFDNPVTSVSLLAGHRDEGVLTMTAYSADDQVITSVEQQLTENLREFAIDDAGIAYVVLRHQNDAAVYVFDDLRFSSIAYEGPGIMLSPAQLDFGLVYLDCEDTISLRITNNGAQDLEIQSMSCDEEAFVLPELGGVVVLGTGERLALDFIFRPGAAGNYTADVLIECNAENAEDGIFRLHASGASAPPPSVELDPSAIEEELFSGGTVDRVVTVSNQGGSPLQFTTEIEILSEPEGRDADERSIRSLDSLAGPRRDDLGDILATYDVPDGGWSGLAFDGELMWGIEREGGRMIAVNLDGEVVRQVNLRLQWPYGLCWDGEALWAATYGSNELTRLDRDGNTIGSIENIPNPFGITWDGEHLWYGFYNDGRGEIVRQIDADGQILRTLDITELEDRRIIQLCWVEDHRDGKMWILTGDEGHVYQLNVDNDRVQIVQHFLFNMDVVIGLAHDGENMWFSRQNDAWRVFDDGAAEAHWIEVRPDEGEIAANSQLELTIVLNAFGLIAGDYQADMHFLSNDPDDADAVVNVLLSVEGAPDITVEWPPRAGFPDLIDFNRIYQDFFCGSEYTQTIKITNDGTDDLVIQGITADNENFSFDPVDLSLRPRQSQEVTITFSAPENPQDINATITIPSNDPDEQEYTIALHANPLMPPDVELDPSAIEEELFSGGAVDRSVVVSNRGGSPLRFTIQREILAEPGGRDETTRAIRSLSAPVEPERDNPGDRLAQYDSPISSVSGMAFAGNLMWGCSMNGNRLVALDMNGDVVHNFQIHNTPEGMTFDGERLWIGSWRGNTVRTYDLEGQNLETFNMNFDQISGMGSNQNGFVFINTDSDNRIHVIDSETHQEVTNFTFRGAMRNANVRSITWVAGHADGQLWGNTTNHVYQAHVDDNWNVQAVQDFAWNSDQTMVGLAHDGENLWHGMWETQTWYVVDDGVAEVRWLSVTPEAGEIAANSQLELTVALNAFGLIAGDYQADVHFLSNDPDNADAVVNVLMHVNGAPDITVRWPGNAGFPEVVDFNRIYPDLFCGSEYTQNILIVNDGTDDLDIQGIRADNNCFSFNPAELVIRPRQSQEVTITFSAPEDAPDDINATLTIPSNDPDEQEYTIALHAHPFYPPMIDLDPISIEEELFSGGAVDRLVTVFNRGGSELRFTVEREILSEPEGRDADARSIRSLAAPVAPRRDDAGDLLAEYNMPFTHTCGMAFDGTNMWGCFSRDDRIIAVDLEGNIVSNIMIHDYPVAMTFDGERLWVGHWSDGVIHTYDLEGRNLETFNLEISRISGMGSNEAGLVFINNDIDDRIHVYNSDDHAEVTNFAFRGAMEDANVRNMTWVKDHPDGQLWANTNGRVYEAHVDEDWNVTPVQNFAWNSDGTINGMAHDGENMWLGMYNTQMWYVYDDGVSESRWLDVRPDEGEIAANGQLDVTIALNALGLIGGDYQADVHFLTNDPDSPDAVVNVLLHVEGAPDVTVEWPEGAGFPEVVDFNRVYPDLFCGSAYTQNIVIANEGTDDLIIQGVRTDNDYFTVNQVDLSIRPRQSQNVTVIFTAPENAPEDFNATLTIPSNDPDEQEYTVALHAHAFLPPVIELNPSSVEEGLFSGGAMDCQITVSNTGDATLRFTVEKEILSEPERRDEDIRSIRSLAAPFGPKRDDPGDLLAQYDAPISSISGMAFDGTLMWGCSYGQGRLAALDLQGNTVVNVGIHAQPMGMTFDGQRLWIGQYPTSRIRTYDLQSQSLETFNMNFDEMLGMGSNKDGLVFINSGSDSRIHVIRSDDQQEVTNFAYRGAMGNANIWGITWVPEHRDGQLWGNSGNTLYQVHVDDDWNCEAVQNFRWNADQEYVGPAHDGENMWHGMWDEQIWYVYDDGVSEVRWLDVTPEEGQVAGDRELAVTLTLSAFDLIGGDYQADVHFLSNDPANPDAVVNVLLNVEGAPDVDVEWSEEAGFPQIIDFNRIYEDLFCSGVYTQTIVIANQGTDDLNIQGIRAGHEYFTFNPADLAIRPRQSQEVTITFSPPADAPEDINTTLIIPSNDPDEQEYSIAMHAHAFMPPIIQLDPWSFEEELPMGTTAEYTLNVANIGDAPLRWNTDAEIVQRPGRDQTDRIVRSLDSPRAPQRDDPLTQYNSPLSTITGMAFDGDLMWGCSYTAGRLAALDLDGNVQHNFQIHNHPLAMTWDGARLWIGQWPGQTMRTYDLEGQLVETFDLPFSGISGLASDQENFILANCDQDQQIHVLNFDDRQQVATFPFHAAMGDANIWGITWVQDHPDGQLWGNAQGHIYQVQVGDNWNVQAVQDFDWGTDQPYVGPAHDGENMWHGMWADQNWYVYDDGVTELRWLTWEPKTGELQTGSDVDVNLILDGRGQIAGDYEADLHFLSNDPRNSDVIANITVHIMEAAPQIVLEPAEMEFGEVDLGQQIHQMLYMRNTGNLDLVISNITAEGGAFRTGFARGITITPGASDSVEVTFTPNRRIHFDGRLVISTNDPQNRRVFVPLSGAGLNRPPGQFSLVSPENGRHIGRDAYAVDFRWQSAENLDQDTISYYLYHHIVFDQMDTTIVSRRLNSNSCIERIDSLFMRLGVVSHIDGIQVPVTWWVEARDGVLTTPSSESWEIVVTAPLFADDQFGNVPANLRLGSAYPNPFNGEVRIDFDLPREMKVRLAVWDVQGKLREVLVEGETRAGSHTACWNGEGAPAGVYLIKLQAGSFSDTRKVMLVK